MSPRNSFLSIGLAAVMQLNGSLASADDGMLGVLVAQQEMELEARIEGQLTAVEVRIGDLVDVGTLIAVLDDEPFVQALSEATATLDAAEARLDTARTQVAIAEEALQRRRALLATQAVSGEAVFEAEQAVVLANSAVNQARAMVSQQSAIVEQYRTHLRHTRVVAPFDGTIAERYLNPGMMASPGRPIVRLISKNALRVRFAAGVDRAADLAIGRHLAVRIPSLGLEVTGTVSQVGSEVDPASGMIICEGIVRVPEELEGLPLAGQTVRATVGSGPED